MAKIKKTKKIKRSKTSEQHKQEQMDKHKSKEVTRMRKTVIFDFDGVIHSYVSGWQGVDKAIDPPIEETIKAIKQLRDDGYKVVVVSTRCDCPDGMETIHKYLDKHGITVDGVYSTKPPAIVSVDDRCICFVPGMDVVSAVKNFHPWRDSSSTPSKGKE